MALERVSLTERISITNNCKKLLFEDVTGAYSENNPDGYGAPDHIEINDILTSKIKVKYIDLGVTVTYDFEVNDGEVIGATITDYKGNVIDILAELSSTDFPFTDDNPFDLTDGYGGELPELHDGQIVVEYTIAGTAVRGEESEDFAYTTSKKLFLTCELCCCIAKMGTDIDPECSCSDNKLEKYMAAKAFLYAGQAAVAICDYPNAAANFKKAKEICTGNCKTC